MNRNKVLIPIENKLDQWIYYKENKPTSPYFSNTKLHDDFRKENDLDCVLTDGNLNADTIFSLWTPLIETIKEIHGKIKPFKSLENMKEIKNNLDYYLPVDNPLVQALSKLFDLGMTRANVMILPERAINVLRYSITKDYMPHFLHLCFEPSSFRDFYKTDETLIKWIKDEHLEMFFYNEEIRQENIKKLSGAEDIKMRKAPNLEDKFKRYIEILEKRSEYYI